MLSATLPVAGRAQSRGGVIFAAREALCPSGLGTAWHDSMSDLGLTQNWLLQPCDHPMRTL